MKPWEGKYFKELMERHQPFYSDDNGIDDVAIIEALEKDWKENYDERCRFYAMEAGSHVRLSDEMTSNQVSEVEK